MSTRAVSRADKSRLLRRQATVGAQNAAALHACSKLALARTEMHEASARDSTSSALCLVHSCGIGRLRDSMLSLTQMNTKFSISKYLAASGQPEPTSYWIELLTSIYQYTIRPAAFAADVYHHSTVCRGSNAFL